MSLIRRVRRTLVERRLLPGGARILVGCSGGPDSTALLYALAELAPGFGFVLTAAAIDHGLRPEASNELRLVAQHADQLGVSFCSRRVAVASGRGKQAGARDARYQALHELAREQGADAIAVGHTLDDQAETVLARLLRAPSVAGLAGIEPVRGDGVVRPLIDCRRAQVARFIAVRRLAVADDPSNRDVAYTRARVRHHVLPLLEAENPQLAEALALLAEDARAHRSLAETLAPDLDLTECEAQQRLREQPAALRRWIVRKWLRRQLGVEPRLAHIMALESSTRGGRVLLPGDREAQWSNEGRLEVRAKPKRTRGRGRQ